MKSTKYLFLAFSFSALVLMSCQREEPDIFEESSSARMTSFLSDVREALINSEYGWTLDYFPGSAYAGTTYTLVFSSQMVTARHESSPSESETSTYNLKTDDGAVLSFDTYNTILHQYATATSTLYQAKGGDFEFEIRSFDRATKEIVLIGKRSRNRCTLRPLTSTPEAYLEKVKEMDMNMDIAAASATIGGKEYEAFLDAGTRSLTIGEKGAPDDSLKTARYILTGETLRFSNSFTVGDVTFDELQFNQGAGTLTGSGITFNKFYPPGYISYQQFLGKFTLYYNNGSRSFPVELVEDERGRTFKMEGLSTFFSPVLGYNGGRGRLTWEKQTVGGSGSLEYILAPWDTGAGYLTWLDGVGMVGAVEDNSVEDFLVEFTDNGVWENYKVSGWLVWSMQDGSSAGAVSSWPMASGSYQLPGAITMKKIVE